MKRFYIICIVLVCAVLSISGCNKPESSDSGLLFMWFNVKGKVVDQSGNPIKGIAVYAESGERVETDANGMFSADGGGLPANTTAVKFVDEDDDVNGTYLTKTAVIALEKYKDGSGWNEGYYRNKEDVVVCMTEEEKITCDPNAGGVQE